MKRIFQKKQLFGIRGATGCKNTTTDIIQAISTLYDEVLQKNHIQEDDIVSVLFTITSDLTVLNPATALRKSGRAQSVALFVAAEPEIEGSIPGIVRILIHCYAPAGHTPQHVYKNGAEILRPDRATF
jgi:chorismate mutase